MNHRKRLPVDIVLRGKKNIAHNVERTTLLPRRKWNRAVAEYKQAVAFLPDFF